MRWRRVLRDSSALRLASDDDVDQAAGNDDGFAYGFAVNVLLYSLGRHHFDHLLIGGRMPAAVKRLCVFTQDQKIVVLARDHESTGKYYYQDHLGAITRLRQR